MKFFSVFALSSLFLGGMAAPLEDKRQINANVDVNVGDVLSLVQGLFTEVQGLTGSINSTATNIGPLSTLKQNQTAANSYQDKVSELTTLVQGTVTKVTQKAGSAGGATNALQARAADADAIAGVLSNVLLEVNGALNNVNGSLGLGSLLGLASPLTDSLSGLLNGVESLVSGVLNLVQGLLGGVLKGLGLSDALSGLIGDQGVLSGLLGGSSNGGLLGIL